MGNEYQNATDRASLGFEYEVALALIDTEQTLTFNEDTYPPIVGGFEHILVTKNVRLTPPNSGLKALRNGYNPSAQLIPAVSEVGRLSFDALDRPTSDRLSYYNGQPCVARVTARIDGAAVRTAYCSYWKPKLSMDSKSGEEAGEATVDGDFHLLTSP